MSDFDINPFKGLVADNGCSTSVVGSSASPGSGVSATSGAAQLSLNTVTPSKTYSTSAPNNSASIGSSPMANPAQASVASEGVSVPVSQLSDTSYVRIRK